MNLSGGAHTFDVSPVMWNGDILNPTLATLNLAVTIGGSGGIIKTGGSNLQFSNQNTFTGGVDLQAGGLIIGASSGAASGRRHGGCRGIAPNISRARQAVRRGNIRELIVPFGRSGYVLRYAYSAAADEAVILRIWHGREARE